MKLAKFLCGTLLTLSVVSCATSSSSPVVSGNGSGFLNDYSLLKEVPSDNDSMKIYRYVNPNFNRSDYHAVILNPVTIYQPRSDQNESALITVRNSLNNYINDSVAQKFTVTKTPDKGVASVEIAITGAEVNNDGFHARNLIPVSAVLKLASMGAGVDNKQAVLLIEARLTDSVTHKLLGQSVTSISSEKFRDSSKSLTELENNANLWVKQTVRNAAGM